MVFEHLKVRPGQRATSAWANTLIDILEMLYGLGRRGEPDNPFHELYGYYGYFFYDLYVQGRRVIKDGDPINLYDIFEPAKQKITQAIENSVLTQYMGDVREKIVKISVDEYGNIGVRIAEPLDEYGNIRTAPYTPLLRSIIREELKTPVTVFVENTLDQDVTVRVKANRVESTTGALNVGAPFTVSANSNDAMTLTPDTSGWLPYIFVELQCSVTPTSGAVTVFLVKSKKDQPKLVDALEIRDTNIHNPYTDPDKIFIREW